MTAPNCPRAVLDACVLYPSVLRDILLGVAARGGFVPLWSARLLAEWQLTAARRGSEQAAEAAQAIAALGRDWPEASVALSGAGVAARVDLPDPGDLHVLEAALAGRADVVVTQNLRDFPRRALAPLGLRAEAADTFLMERWLVLPRAVCDSVEAARAEAARRADRVVPLRALLRRAGLPRLGKALDAGGGSGDGTGDSTGWDRAAGRG